MDALHGRDAEALDELDRFVTPDHEFHAALAPFVESAEYRGREGLEAYVAEIEETRDVFHVVPDEFRDLGDRGVLAARRLAHHPATPSTRPS